MLANGRAQTAESRDHLVEDQKELVLVADLAKPLEVSLRRDEDSRRPRDRLDDDGGDGRFVVQRDDRFEGVREMSAPLRLPAAEGVVREIVRMGQMVDAGEERSKEFPIVRNSPDGDASESDSVVAAFPSDQPLPGALTANPVIGESDLERRVHGL